MWRWQAQEIEAADPQPGELDALEAELARLEHGEALARASGEAYEALYGRDRSLCSQLGRHEEALVRAAAVDAALEPMVERMASARTELEDLAMELDAYARGVDASPLRLEELRERRSVLLSLCRKHACDLDGVLEKRAELDERLALLDDAEHHLERRRAKADECLARAGAVARRLSEARQAAARALGDAITTELADLGMGQARVEVELSVPDATDATALSFEGARLSSSGLDHAELLIAPNPGEPPRPLSRVASGGELSRSLLAIKRVLAGMGPVGLYVFDEVDTGVGGAVSDAIAAKLAEVATHHQVLCITHQAQIAAWGEAHYVVAKTVAAERTFSHIRALADDERVDELARMLGGRTVTDTTREAARELLDAAQRGRDSAPRVTAQRGIPAGREVQPCRVSSP
jgi:DNA repair protein RecN (Recombination protein N)